MKHLFLSIEGKNQLPARLVYLIIIILFVSCSKEPRKVEASFYYWRTVFNLSDNEKQILNELHIRKLYIRFFDVDWNPQTNQPQPLEEISFKTSPTYYRVIPVIYITNKTLLNLKKDKLAQLAQNIRNKIYSIYDSSKINEIQLDCDWTKSTKEKYFQLIKTLKEISAQKEITSTIRLHQIKDFKQTGVPPCNQGMVMAYNIEKLQNINTRNSIFNLGLAKNYLQNLEDYPLNTGIAIPFFSQGIIFRNAKAINLINNFNPHDTTRFRNLGDNKYLVLQTTYESGHLLYQNDLIRNEVVPYTDLKKFSEFVSKKINSKQIDLVFFSLDSNITAKYSHNEIKDIINTFR